MTDASLTVTIGANAASLRAEVEVAKASVRSLETEVRRYATSVSKTGDPAKMIGLTELAGRAEAARAGLGALSKDLEHASAGVKGLSLASSGATRELIVLAHEMSQGNYSRFGGSMMVLAERAGGLHEMLGGLSGTMVAVGGAALVLGGSIGYAAYQAYEAHKNLTLLNAELALTGRGNISTADLDKGAGALADKWGLTKAAALAAISEIAKASRGLSYDQVKMVADMAAAEAKLRKVPIGDVAAEYKIKDTAAAIALANSWGLVTTAQERMLKNGDALGAMNSVLQLMKENIDKHGGAWAAARARYEEYQAAVRTLVLAGGVDPTGANTNSLGPEPANPGREAPTGSGAQEWMAQWMAEHGVSANAQKAIGGNASVESSFNSKAGLGTAHQGYFQWDAARWAAGGSPADDAGKQLELMLKEIEQRIPGFTKSNAPVADLTRQFEEKFEVSGGQLLPQRLAAANAFQPATGPNAPEQEKAQREAATKAEAIDQQARMLEHRHSLEQQLADAKAHAVALADLHGQESNEVKEAIVQVGQKQNQIYDQDTNLYIAGLKAKQAASRDFAEKLGIQDQITAYRQQRGASSQGGGVDKAAVAQDAIERANLEREQSRESIQTRIQTNDRLRTLDELYLQQAVASARLKVIQGQSTNEQALKYDAQYGDGLLTQQRARLEALSAVAGLSSVELARLQDGIKRIDVERLTKTAESLEKQGADAKAIADKWAAPFKSAFDSVGSTMESSISGLLERSKTLSQVWGDIGKSATGAAVNVVGSTLSKTAAGFVPGSKPGEGLGEAAGNLASNWLGKQLQSLIPSLATSAVSTGTNAEQAAAVTTAMTEMATTTTASMTEMAGDVTGSMAEMATAVTTAMAAMVDMAAIKTAIPFAAGGYDVPSFATGSWSVPGGLSMLHPNEMVLPANLANTVRTAAKAGNWSLGVRAPGAPSLSSSNMQAPPGLGGGGGDTHVHIAPTFHGPADPPSMARWFDQNKSHIVRQVQSGLRSNALTPRSI